jgi:hypothetical protein
MLLKIKLKRKKSRPRFLTHLEEDKNDGYSGVPFINDYILYSNAFNVEDEVIDSLYALNSNWELVKKYTNNRIFISLYRKRIPF